MLSGQMSAKQACLQILPDVPAGVPWVHLHVLAPVRKLKFLQG